MDNIMKAVAHFRWLMDVGALTREEEGPLAVLETDIPALVAELDAVKRDYVRVAEQLYHEHRINEALRSQLNAYATSNKV